MRDTNMEINATKFRSNCLKLIDEVHVKRNEVILVTRDQKLTDSPHVETLW